MPRFRFAVYCYRKRNSKAKTIDQKSTYLASSALGLFDQLMKNRNIGRMYYLQLVPTDRRKWAGWEVTIYQVYRETYVWKELTHEKIEELAMMAWDAAKERTGEVIWDFDHKDIKKRARLVRKLLCKGKKS